jgi:prefoldin subunit 5
MASGLDDLQNQALNSVEVAKQLEQLTDVVLSSAEVSTRSASVAADVSHDMRLVMESVSEDHKTNIRNSRIMVGSMLLFLVIGLGTFFAISTKMQLHIGELNAMSLAVGKRIVELDATVGAFTQASRSMNELTEKLEEMNHNQEKIEGKFEDINKQMAAMPVQIADQSSKSLEAKLQALEKQIQTLDAKVQTLSNRPAAPPAVGAADLQKLKRELELANAKNKEKPEPKAETKAEPKAETKAAPVAPKQEPKPGAKLERGEHAQSSEALNTPAAKESSQRREVAQAKPAGAEPEKTSSKVGSQKTVDNKSSQDAHSTKEARDNKSLKDIKDTKEAADTTPKPVTAVVAQRKDGVIVYPRPSSTAEN